MRWRENCPGACCRARTPAHGGSHLGIRREFPGPDLIHLQQDDGAPAPNGPPPAALPRYGPFPTRSSAASACPHGRYTLQFVSFCVPMVEAHGNPIWSNHLGRSTFTRQGRGPKQAERRIRSSIGSRTGCECRSIAITARGYRRRGVESDPRSGGSSARSLTACRFMARTKVMAKLQGRRFRKGGTEVVRHLRSSLVSGTPGAAPAGSRAHDRRDPAPRARRVRRLAE